MITVNVIGSCSANLTVITSSLSSSSPTVCPLAWRKSPVREIKFAQRLSIKSPPSSSSTENGGSKQIETTVPQFGFRAGKVTSAAM